MKIDDKLILPDGKGARARIKKLTKIFYHINKKKGWGFLRTRKYLEADTVDAKVITDDNMISEWKSWH